MMADSFITTADDATAFRRVAFATSLGAGMITGPDAARRGDDRLAARD
jgi:hypothetical protein